MVERWNIVFQEDMGHFNFMVNPVGGGTINPIFHYSLIGVESTSRRPLLQYSIIPIARH